MKMYWCKLISVWGLLIAFQCAECFVINREDGPVVETNVGVIRGLEASDGSYDMFLGIPYGTVSGSNVFGSATPYPPFEDVFDANDDSVVCPQVEEFNSTTVGNLDCLHLNVFVPKINNAQNPLPVMAYIYGGGFSIGFYNRFMYGPEFLVRHDVILVTLNYRLGPYGFMCLGTSEIPGNAGFKDQVMALRWIQNNIAQFGGDPNQVTLFGNSAGGMSIGMHLISETENLYSNVIMQSGSGFYPNTVETAPDDTEKVLLIAAALNFETNNVDEAIAFLSNADPLAVIDATTSQSISFSACLEQEFSNVERFLAEIPINSNHSKVENVAVMLGYNTEEALVLYGSEMSPEVLDSQQQIFDGFVMGSFDLEEEKLIQLSNNIRRFYIGDEAIDNNVREELMHAVSDRTFVYPTIRSVAPYLKAGAAKIYQYVFSYDGNRNFAKILHGETAPGAAHADEIGYLFEMDFIPEIPDVNDQLIIDRMTAMWTNFVKYRDPTPEINELLPTKWEPITVGSPYHYININTELTTGMRYEHRRMSFWDLFYKGYEKYETGYVDPDHAVEEEEEDEDVDEDNSSFSVYPCSLLILSCYIIKNLLANQ